MKIEKEISNSNWSKVEERRKNYIHKSLSTKENTISRKGIEHLISSLLNRRQFSYSTKDLVLWAFYCVPCRRRADLKRWMLFD